MNDILSVDSRKAMSLLQNNQSAYLIDVRTNAEWRKIGIPLILNSKNYLQLSWRHGEDMSINNNFEKELMSLVVDKNSLLFFLCRSGIRSLEAAMSMADNGYMNCYNIYDGFEGTNFQNGWKNNKLPFELRT